MKPWVALAAGTLLLLLISMVSSPILSRQLTSRMGLLLARAEVRDLARACNMFKADHKRYPRDLEELVDKYLTPDDMRRTMSRVKIVYLPPGDHTKKEPVDLIHGTFESFTLVGNSKGDVTDNAPK